MSYAERQRRRRNEDQLDDDDKPSFKPPARPTFKGKPGEKNESTKKKLGGKRTKEIDMHED
jgi:hypothetical protein